MSKIISSSHNPLVVIGRMKAAKSGSAVDWMPGKKPFFYKQASL
jgi:hypothetical protein